MTPRQQSILRILVPLVGTLFVAGAMWQDTQRDIKEKLPTQRFENDSVARDGVTTLFLRNQTEVSHQLQELNSRMKEVCIALKGQAGCK